MTRMRWLPLSATMTLPVVGNTKAKQICRHHYYYNPRTLPSIVYPATRPAGISRGGVARVGCADVYRASSSTHDPAPCK